MSKAGRSRHCKGWEGGTIDKVGNCKKRLYDYYTEKAGIRFRSFGFLWNLRNVIEIPMRTIGESLLSISQDRDGCR